MVNAPAPQLEVVRQLEKACYGRLTRENENGRFPKKIPASVG